MAAPACLAVFTLGLHVGLAAMKMDNSMDDACIVLLKLLYSVAAFWYAYKLVGVVEVGLSRIGNITEIEIDSQLIDPIRKTLRIFVVVIAVLFIASAVLGCDVRAWLAGLGIAGLGGHTPGSTMFAVAVNGRLWLFSGDTTNSKADLLSDTGKGFLYSYLMVPEDTARTGELRRWFAGLDAEADMQVVVSHDIADIEASDLRRWAAYGPGSR